jgi:capsular polysaccharide biosynthesis protein
MDEYEISLRDIIETIWKGRYIVVGITAVAVIASAVLSFFVLPVVYEAQVKLILTEVKGPTAAGNTLSDIRLYPDFTMESYKVQVKSPEVLQKTIDELNLAPGMTVSKLSGAVNAEDIKNTNLLIVKAKHSDPDLAKQIANSIARNFSAFVTELSQASSERSLLYLEGQLAVEAEKLDKVRNELVSFLQQPRGVEELESEKSSKIRQLTQFKEQVVQTDIAISASEVALRTAKDLLKNTPMELITAQSIASEPALLVLLSNLNLSAEDMAKMQTQSEEINPVHITLQESIVTTEIEVARLRTTNAETRLHMLALEQELENLQVDLAQKKHTQSLLERQVSLSQGTYNVFLGKLDEARIAQTAKLGESNIIVGSYAVKPTAPVSPRRMLNIAIAGVLGSMLSLGVIFIKSLWDTPSPAVGQSKYTA